MVDDKDDPTPDPWAGIDAGGSAEPAEDFSFSLDATGESAPEPAIGDLGDLAGLDSLSDLGDLAFAPAAAAAEDEVDEVDEVIEEVEVEEAIFPMTFMTLATSLWMRLRPPLARRSTRWRPKNRSSP